MNKFDFNAKYDSFKIDDECIKMVDGEYGKHPKVMKCCFVRGQRTADYNWELLAEFDSVDDAKKYVKSMLTEGIFQRVYNSKGEGIECLL